MPALRPALLRALAVGLALLAPRAGAAQPATETEMAIPETAVAAADSAAVDSAAADSLVVPIESAASEVPGFWKRPTGVMLHSLAIPGWGQATNGQWIKAGVAFAIEGALIAGIIADTVKLSDLDAEDPERSQLLDDRQAKWWWLGGAVFLSMVDAYVSAHLRDFDIEAEPAASAGGSPGFAARVAFSFP